MLKREPKLVGAGLVIVALCVSSRIYGQIPPIPVPVQRSLERVIGHRGTYSASEGAFKIHISRSDVTLSVQDQRVPWLLVDSWVAFSPEIHHDALVVSELSLRDDQVNPVVGAALRKPSATY
jgi:hypothetical protein